jgi:hypothetical protein
MGEHEPDDELQVDEAPITGAARTPTRLSGRLWRSALVSLVVVVVLVILADASPLHQAIFGKTTTPTATPAPFPSPTVIPLGAVPTTCPPGQAVTTFSPEFGPGVEADVMNVWLVGFFSGPEPILHLATDRHTDNGWSEKLLLVAGSEVTQPITLSASVVTIGLDPVLFSADAPGGGTPTVSFDPATVPAQGGWRTWPLYITIRAAGCYLFQVQSDNSQAVWFFAAGR